MSLKCKTVQRIPNLVATDTQTLSLSLNISNLNTVDINIRFIVPDVDVCT